MIKLILSVLTIATVSFAGIITTTNTYNFTPTPNDLGDLQHDRASSWGINMSLSQGEVITSAVLKVNNLYDWLNDEWNALFIDLLDNAPTGVTTYQDLNMGANYEYDWWNMGKGVDDDYFADPRWTKIGLDRLNYNGGSNPYLHSARTNSSDYNGEMVWSQDLGRNVEAFDVSIALTSSEITTLTNYINNGHNFGFGVDADCHFYNSGFEFTVTTQTTRDVPEPATLSLFGCSLLGLLFFRRKRN